MSGGDLNDSLWTVEKWGPQGQVMNIGCGICALVLMACGTIVACYKLLAWGGVIR